MQRLFVDTSAWIGLEVSDDQYHTLAFTFQRGTGRQYGWVTTNWVVWETVTWLTMRRNHAAAVRFVERVHASRLVELVTVGQEDEQRAWRTFKRYDDLALSFIDCSSFAVMESLGLLTAFTFDGHFRQAGYQAVPLAVR